MNVFTKKRPKYFFMKRLGRYGVKDRFRTGDLQNHNLAL
jgi:hypothetical protein